MAQKTMTEDIYYAALLWQKEASDISKSELLMFLYFT